MSARVELVHQARGRLRLRVDGSSREIREVLNAVANSCAGAAVPLDVTTNARTGSALVSWDPERLDADAALDLLREAHDALITLLPRGLADRLNDSGSLVARAVAARVATANRTVGRATNGTVDLRMAVPITLGALSVRQLLRTGPQFAKTPWYVLAYYTFDTFFKLHGNGRPGAVADTT